MADKVRGRPKGSGKSLKRCRGKAMSTTQATAAASDYTSQDNCAECGCSEHPVVNCVWRSR